MMDDKARLDHILEAISRIELYMSDGSRDIKTEDAIIRQLAVIGEAASRLTTTLRAKAHDVPWGAIIGMRNLLVHEYYRVEIFKIWDVVEHHMPTLKKAVSALYEREK